MNEEPIVILPNRTDSERLYNHKLLTDKETLMAFLKSNEIKGWPTTNRDNPAHYHQNSYGGSLKFWDGYFIG
jgi:hypothetical protein